LEGAPVATADAAAVASDAMAAPDATAALVAVAVGLVATLEFLGKVRESTFGLGLTRRRNTDDILSVY
jgi:hypothetical protein